MPPMRTPVLLDSIVIPLEQGLRLDAPDADTGTA